MVLFWNSQMLKIRLYNVCLMYNMDNVTDAETVGIFVNLSATSTD